MPKLRNASSDLGKMTQYLARKCVIHSPQAELDLSETDQKRLPNQGKRYDNKWAKVHTMKERGQAGEANAFVAISPNGRAIKVTLEEMDPSTLDQFVLGKVGT